ncbi:thioredoxin [Hygrophoropsis aurantiaca]|uniref:Thioredoxin n=1 Tax=Hygrophoropsis aurantiaca TaxID=72124 RepID=A0ACB8ADN5_9AGAM|nr:thioredoxin [Hygrophoropsis aurantiaca]
MPVTEITSHEELEEIASRPDRVAVIDFWAPWCIPCTRISPVFEAKSNEENRIDFYKVNVEDVPFPEDSQFQIASLPAFKAYKGKTLLDSLVGAYPDKLNEMIVQVATNHAV